MDKQNNPPKTLKIDLKDVVFCDPNMFKKKILNSQSFSFVFMFCVANFQAHKNKFDLKKIKSFIDYEPDTIRKCLEILIDNKMLGKFTKRGRANYYVIYNKILDEELIMLSKDRWLNG